MFNRLKMGLLNLGLKFISIDEKIVRMTLETSPSNINEIVVLPAITLVTKKIVNVLQNKNTHGRVINGNINGVNISVIQSFIGAPNVALVMESLKRSKAKIVIRVDFCGGIELMTNSVSIGDILIPRLVYCGDGTSPQYVIYGENFAQKLNSIKNPLLKVHEFNTGNPQVFISRPNIELNSLILKEGELLFSNKVREVDFWSTDAMFCETDDFVNSLKSINVQGIDMESSTLFLLGQLYNLKTAALLSVSDLPGNAKFDMLRSNEIHPNMELGINNAIKILHTLLPKVTTLVK